MWADEIAPDTLPGFEQKSNIHVRVAYFDSPEMLESHVLAGNSGYDVVMPSDAFVQRHLRSGAYLELDKSKLPNLAHLDSSLMARVANSDPGNAHTVIYDWGTMGIGYNQAMLAKRVPDAAVDSWRFVFDPAIASKLSDCGISLIDDPVGIVRPVLLSMHRNPNEPRPEDLADAAEVMSRFRPFIRNIDTANQIESLANGDLCAVVAYNGNVMQASRRALDAKNGINIGYSIPKEGSLLWFDLLAIPKDAPHLDNAYKLINYLLEPQVAANNSNAVGFANANKDAGPLLQAAIASNPAIYPTAEEKRRLFIQSELSLDQIRTITRIWQKFKTGQ